MRLFRGEKIDKDSNRLPSSLFSFFLIVDLLT